MSYRIHGVTVTDATRREFRRNQSNLKKEGIKSAYSLQKLKNEQTKIKKSARKAVREAVRKAYKKDAEKLETMGYTVEDFIKFQNQFFEYNEKIQNLKEKGVVYPDTGVVTMPITYNTGKINLYRLQKILNKIKRFTPSKISMRQREVFMNNVELTFGDDVRREVEEALSESSNNKIYTTFIQYETFSFLVKYDAEAFDDESFDMYYASLRNNLSFFWELVEEVRSI